mmetsp:Transcript_5358/g.8313  ORF Transcript_5358/g.8313 Transcript_5358/m.8313 type:complete len:142 (-) Transcript_5358:1781-2206(-)
MIVGYAKEFRMLDEVINFVSESGETALTICAEYGYLECLKEVLSNGANLRYVHEEDDWGPFYLACYERHLAVVEYLLQNGSDPNTTCDGVTCLHNAVFDGDEELVKLLLGAGASKDIPSLGALPHEVAQTRNNVSILELLK